MQVANTEHHWSPLLLPLGRRSSRGRKFLLPVSPSPLFLNFYSRELRLQAHHYSLGSFTERNERNRIGFKFGDCAARFLVSMNEFEHLVRLSLTGINLSEGARNER